MVPEHNESERFPLYAEKLDAKVFEEQEKAVEFCKSDTRFLMHNLVTICKDMPFDMHNISMVGHSLGGRVTMGLVNEMHLKAGVCLDPRYLDTDSIPGHIPVLHILSDKAVRSLTFPGVSTDNMPHLNSSIQYAAYLKNSGHNSFEAMGVCKEIISNLHLVVPDLDRDVGPANGIDNMHHITSTIRSFLDKFSGKNTGESLDFTFKPAEAYEVIPTRKTLARAAAIGVSVGREVLPSATSHAHTSSSRLVQRVDKQTGLS